MSDESVLSRIRAYVRNNAEPDDALFDKFDDRRQFEVSYRIPTTLATDLVVTWTQRDLIRIYRWGRMNGNRKICSDITKLFAAIDKREGTITNLDRCMRHGKGARESPVDKSWKDNLNSTI